MIQEGIRCHCSHFTSILNKTDPLYIINFDQIYRLSQYGFVYGSTSPVVIFFCSIFLKCPVSSLQSIADIHVMVIYYNNPIEHDF